MSTLVNEACATIESTSLTHTHTHTHTHTNIHSQMGVEMRRVRQLSQSHAVSLHYDD